MAVEYSYTDARDHLASLMDRVVSEHEVLKIRRRLTGGAFQEVALIDADELASLQETAHLLRSPKNAERLFSALARALTEEGEIISVDDLAREYGINPEEIPGTDLVAKISED